MVIKVLTFNIWHGKLLDEVIDFLKQQDADIVALQEVYNGQDSNLSEQYRAATVLKERLDYDYSYFSAEYLYTKMRVDEGNLILSKFPVINAKAAFIDTPYGESDNENPDDFATMPRVLQHVELDSPAGVLNIVNFHGVWDLDGDNYSPQRKKMAQAIIDGVHGKHKVIVAGDTNAKPTNPAMKEVEKYLKSVFGNDLKTTFNMRRKDNPGYATAAVDMMFVSNDIKILNKKCLDVDLSDHLPLVATFEI